MTLLLLYFDAHRLKMFNFLFSSIAKNFHFHLSSELDSPDESSCLSKRVYASAFVDVNCSSHCSLINKRWHLTHFIAQDVASKT